MSRSESIEMVFRQKGVDDGSKRRAGTRETEVRLNGWCEDVLGQQRNDGVGCAPMRRRSERVLTVEPWCICN